MILQGQMVMKMLRMVLLSSSLLVSSLAYAQSAYVGPLNSGLGNGATVSCGACHSTSPQSGGNAVLPMANTWRSGANLALSDSDGDGFNNAQEVNGGSTNFNYNANSPFTLAKAVEGSPSVNVVVVGGGQVSEPSVTAAIASQLGITLAAGHTIAGGVAPLINTAVTPTPTIYFNRAVNAGDKVYTVDFTVATPIATPINTVTFNADGSVTVSGLPSATNINIVVDRATPAIPVAGATRGGEDEEGCVSGSLSTPLLMMLGLLGLGLLFRRKQV